MHLVKEVSVFKPKRGGKFYLSFDLYRALIGFVLLLGGSSFVPQARAETGTGEHSAPVIVALGDSLMAGYGLAPNEGFVPQLQAALEKAGHRAIVKNAGVSGDTSTGGLARLDWAIGADTDAVILELGANDMLRGIAPHVTRKNLQTIIERLQARNIDVLLAGMLAAPNLGEDYAARFNPIYPELAKSHGLIFYPFFLDGVAGQRRLNLPDGIHPTAEGIGIIVEGILPSIDTLLTRLKRK